MTIIQKLCFPPLSEGSYGEARGKRQQVEVALASLEREFRLGETLATTLVGLATGVAAKVAAYTYVRMLRQPDLGQTSRPHQGTVGMSETTLI